MDNSLCSPEEAAKTQRSWVTNPRVTKPGSHRGRRQTRVSQTPRLVLATSRPSVPFQLAASASGPRFFPWLKMYEVSEGLTSLSLAGDNLLLPHLAAEGAMVPNLVLASQDIPSQWGLGAPMVRVGSTHKSQGEGHGCPLGEIQWNYLFLSVMGWIVSPKKICWSPNPQLPMTDLIWK